jgi:hypothetical protein
MELSIAVSSIIIMGTCCSPKLHGHLKISMSMLTILSMYRLHCYNLGLLYLLMLIEWLRENFWKIGL